MNILLLSIFIIQVTDVEDTTGDLDGNADEEACVSDPESQTEAKSTKRPLPQPSSSRKRERKLIQKMNYYKKQSIVWKQQLWKNLV